MTDDKNKNLKEKPPVIAVMGHIDHGKSTLLDYIRKTNIAEKEAGGITQHIAAYEVVHKDKDGNEKKITFLDTPGHEAFGSIRQRGANVADIAILIVSAEDGVKPQTIEAYQCIQKDGLPFVVAINKIDKSGADIERTKQNLAENDIFLEGYGGKISWVPISAKTGEGINDLLDLLLLLAELEDFRADPSVLGEGVIIETSMDTKKGASATVIINNGVVKKGGFAISGESISPLRIVEDFKGKPVSEATFSSPIKIIGWDKLPQVGSLFKVVANKKEAQGIVQETLLNKKPEEDTSMTAEEKELTMIPIVIKADTEGSLEAIKYELSKIKNDRVRIKILASEVGNINEGDIKLASVNENALLVGFNVKVDAQARSTSERLGVNIQVFDIIYKLTEWLEEAIKDQTPSIEVEEVVGRAKILKVFSKTKDKQVVGGKVQEGKMNINSQVKILRRDMEIGFGKMKDLQMQKVSVETVPEGNEFGTLIDSKAQIAPGDYIEAIEIVKK